MHSLPTKKNILIYFIWSVIITVLFVSVYKFTNDSGSLSATTYKMYFDWELGIPFVPQFIFVYFSLNLLMSMPVFVLETKDVHHYGLSIVLALFVGGIIFYLFPGELGFNRKVSAGGLQFIFDKLYYVDKPHNLLPSLHITFSALSYLAVRKYAVARWKYIYLVWLCLIMLSVVMVHQHHILDVVAGTMLAFYSYKIANKLGENFL